MFAEKLLNLSVGHWISVSKEYNSESYFSFRLKRICCFLSKNAFYWPRGPSISDPKRSAGQMPECSSGIRSCHVLFSSENVFLFVWRQKRRSQLLKKSSRRTSACHHQVPAGAAGLFLGLSPIRDQKAYLDGSESVYQQQAQQKGQLCPSVKQAISSKLTERIMFDRLKVPAHAL